MLYLADPSRLEKAPIFGACSSSSGSNSNFWSDMAIMIVEEKQQKAVKLVSWEESGQNRNHLIEKFKFSIWKEAD